MEQSASDVVARPSDGFVRWFVMSKLAPGWLGLALALGWPPAVGFIHMLASFAIGPAQLPFTPARFAWTLLVNGALYGLFLAGHAYLYLGVASDLRKLQPILPVRDQDLAKLAFEISNLSGPVRWSVTLAGVLGGLAVATLDPTLRILYQDLSPADPRYFVFIMQNVLFGVLGTRLFATEVHMTRAYARLGEQVEVDLLDPSPVLVFGRKGLRSVVVWILISSAISMFWVLDAAGQANFLLSIVVLALAVVALLAPTRGIRRNIANAKAHELARVAAAMRAERDAVLADRDAAGPACDARLGNLVQYQALVKSVREWPFDLSIASRSLLFIVLGAGSWLGGAVVERLLGLLLD